MRHTLRLLVVAAALARVASAESYRDAGGDVAPRAMPLLSFEVAGGDLPLAEETGLASTVRQPGAAADFAAAFGAASRAPLRPAPMSNLESETMLGFFSPAGFGGLFYLVAVVLGCYYRWLFQRTRERGRFVTQRPQVWEARRAA